MILKKNFKRFILPLKLATFFLTTVTFTTSIAYYLYSTVNESFEYYETDENILISGSGTSYPLAIYWKWMEIYQESIRQLNSLESIGHKKNITFQYTPVGSGTGQNEFFTGVTLFGGTTSDVAKTSYLKYYLPENFDLNNDTSTLLNYTNLNTPEHLGVLQLPTNIGAIGIAYNVPEAFNSSLPPLIFNSSGKKNNKEKEIKINSLIQVLGDIFAGSILYWNDAAIQELNPNIKLPNKSITVAGTTVSSGSCLVFTNYLEAHSKNFKNKVGASLTPKWPSTFIKRPLIMDLLYVAETLQYSITYTSLDVFYKTHNQAVRLGQIVNLSGKAIFPTTESVQMAMDSQDIVAKRHNNVSITDTNIEDAYPLSLVTYILLRENYYYFAEGSEIDCKKVQYLIEFWNWTMTSMDGIRAAKDNYWAALSGKSLQANIDILNTVTCNNISINSIVTQEFEKLMFYDYDYMTIRWVEALTFWELSFTDQTKFNRIIYIVYYLMIIILSTFSALYNFKSLSKINKKKLLELKLRTSLKNDEEFFDLNNTKNLKLNLETTKKTEDEEKGTKKLDNTKKDEEEKKIVRPSLQNQIG
ncbi:hypothetical protein HK099_008551, partial [Clydaea vesicula]